MDTKAELAIDMKELEEDRRYGLILRGVKMGLNKIGIENVGISTPTVRDGKFVFEVSRLPG